MKLRDTGSSALYADKPGLHLPGKQWVLEDEHLPRCT